MTEKDAQTERANRLHKTIDDVAENGPQKTKDESPRDFINRKMAEIDETEKKKEDE